MNVLDATSLILPIGFTAAAVVMDFRNMRISNRLILAGLVISLILRIWQGGVSEVLPYLWNITFPVFVLYLLYLIGVLGAGDVKLFSLIGGFVNFTMLVSCIVAAFLVGAVLSLFKMLFCGEPIAQLYAGGVYLLSLLRGNRQRYSWDREDSGKLIHFSLPILIGLILSAQIRFL